MRPKRLGYVDICGIPFEVVEVDADSKSEAFEDIDDCWGYCDPATSRIVLRKGMTPSQFRNTIAHEGQHAIWDNSGLTELVASALKKPREHARVAEFEEQFIRMLTPHLLRFLVSVGDLKR